MTKLVGCTTDGAQAMLGRKSGFQVRVKTVSPSSVYCFLHRLLFVCLWLPLLFLGMEVRHAVNLIEIRLGERWQLISNQS